MQDKWGRTIDYLRVALTDRCNLKCWYCVGRGDNHNIPAAQQLSYDEVTRILRLAVERLGVTKIRLTGGEPLLYEPLEDVVRFLRALPDLHELTLTTNGLLLAQKAQMLRRAGVHRVNVSLQGASDEAYRLNTGGNGPGQVLAGLDALLQAGYDKPKLNIVLCRNFAREELKHILEIGQRFARELRFIELMGHDEQHSPSVEEITRAFATFAPLTPLPGAGTATRRYALAGYEVILGMIPSRTQPFCTQCRRIRLASDGQLRTCLFKRQGIELRPWLRHGCSDDELAQVMRESILNKAPQAVDNQLRMCRVGG